MEEHTYDSYQPGVTGACPKGLKTFSCLAEIGPNGTVGGYVRVHYSYDEKKRPVKIHTRYNDGSEMIEQMQYTFAGEVESRNYIYICGSNEDRMEVSYEYDGRGRLRKEETVLQGKGMQPQIAIVGHGYDALGRPSTVASYVPGGTQLAASSAYALQGWQTSHSVKLNNRQLFVQNLGYDSQTSHSGHVPQHSGMVTVKSEQWHQSSGSPVQSQEWYLYDHAGRLKKEYADGQMLTYTYDSRGNILSAKRVGSTGQFIHSYAYKGDIVQSMTLVGQNSQQTGSFTHDALGRMTFDGTTGQSMTYNSLDLVGNISNNGTNLVNYSYLSDGTKLSALNGSGEGLVYRGPFVYRKGAGNGNSSLTLESAAFGGGRLTPSGAMLYVRDYLGSVRAVVDGKTGELYKAADYSAFGDESAVMVPQWGSAPAVPLATASLPEGTTLRDGYTGKEAQNPDFSTGYTDFGARQYSPSLRRWMTPDPLSEKYYGISPYAFCNNNPVNLVDPDGRACGIFVDSKGNILGDDGNEDNKVYLMLDSADKKVTKSFITSNSGDSQAFESNSKIYDEFVEIEGSVENRSEMMRIVGQDDGNGGLADKNNREYGGVVNNGKVVEAPMGEVASLIDDKKASIMLPAGYPSFHSHPSGSFYNAQSGDTYVYIQEPSVDDISTAENFNHYVFAMRSRVVYIYNKTGTIAHMKMNRFVNFK